MTLQNRKAATTALRQVVTEYGFHILSDSGQLRVLLAGELPAGSTDPRTISDVARAGVAVLLADTMSCGVPVGLAIARVACRLSQRAGLDQATATEVTQLMADAITHATPALAFCA